MKKFILVLLFVVFLIDLKAQTKVATESKETKAINKKIDQAIRHWKQNPMTDFPDIKAIIQNEIMTSINQKTGIIDLDDMVKNRK